MLHSPIEAAWQWLSLVAQGDIVAAWPLMDLDLRLVVGTQLAGDSIGARLAEPMLDVGRWPSIASALAVKLQSLIAGFDPETWGSGTVRGPIREGYEAAMFADRRDEDVVFAKPSGLVVVMHQTSDGWLVAGIKRLQE